MTGRERIPVSDESRQQTFSLVECGKLEAGL